MPESEVGGGPHESDAERSPHCSLSSAMPESEVESTYFSWHRSTIVEGLKVHLGTSRL